jgi:hypothetical protein
MRGNDHPRIIRGAPVKSMLNIGNPSAIPRVRREHLPTAAVASRPGFFIQIPAPRRVRRKRRPAEHLPPGREIDQIQNLSAMLRIDSRQKM